MVNPHRIQLLGKIWHRAACCFGPYGTRPKADPKRYAQQQAVILYPYIYINGKLNNRPVLHQGLTSGFQLACYEPIKVY